MKTEEIESQLFTSGEVPQEEVIAHKPCEDNYLNYQQQSKKELDDILTSTDNELIKCYRLYRHSLYINCPIFVDGNCWDTLLIFFDRLKLDKKYVLDDYRSKASNDNTLRLYARHKKTPRPSERKFIEWEYYNDRLSLFHAKEKLDFDVRLTEDEFDGDYPGFDKPKDMPPMIKPHEVITLNFDVLSIWQAYLLRITDYFIGQRWHGGYHKLEMIFDPKKDIRVFFMKKEERIEYARQLEALHPDYEPHVIINGNKAKVRHLALIGDTRITECTCTITYNPKTRRIEKFEFDDSELIKIPRVFWY